MYEHAIPQNIMDYEFKLFAGLTLKQFIYVALSGGFAFGLFQLNKVGAFPTLFAWMTIPTILIVGIGLGLGSYNKRSMEEWLNAYVKANNMSLRRVWKKDATPVRASHFYDTKPTYLPGYLAAYLLSKDEFLQVARNANSAPGTVNAVFDMPETIPTINLTPSTSYEYADIGIQMPQVPNTVAFRLQEDEIALEGVIATVKDPSGQIVTSLRSNKDGILYFNQPFASGEYSIDFQLPDTATLPRITILFDGSTYPLLNLSPVE